MSSGYRVTGAARHWLACMADGAWAPRGLNNGVGPVLRSLDGDELGVPGTYLRKFRDAGWVQPEPDGKRWVISELGRIVLRYSDQT